MLAATGPRGTMPEMSTRPAPGRDPLAGVELVLVDGSNLLHALSRPAAAGPGAAMPASAVVGRIRAAIPAGTHVQLHLDGPPSGVSGKLAPAMDVVHAGRTTADARIVDVVRRYAEAGPAATWELLVVTDDRDLRAEVQRRGARTAGTSWLIARIGGVAAGPRPAGSRPGPGRQGPAARPAGPGTPPPPRPASGTGFGHARPPLRIEPDADEAADRGPAPHARRRGGPGRRRGC
jgi:hypothetical protein